MVFLTVSVRNNGGHNTEATVRQHIDGILSQKPKALSPYSWGPEGIGAVCSMAQNSYPSSFQDTGSGLQATAVTEYGVDTLQVHYLAPVNPLSRSGDTLVCHKTQCLSQDSMLSHLGLDILCKGSLTGAMLAKPGSL